MMKPFNFFSRLLLLVTVLFSLFVALFFFYSFFQNPLEEQYSPNPSLPKNPENQLLLQIQNFETEFANYLIDLFDDLLERPGEKNSKVLGQQALLKLKNFEQEIAPREKLPANLKEKLLALEFEIYTQFFNEREKTEVLLSQLSPSRRKLALLLNYARFFAPLEEEEKILQFVRTQQQWAEPLMPNYISAVEQIIFSYNPQGKIAPDLFVDKKSLHGEPLALDRFRKEKKYVFLDFWATWCLPCLQEFPHLKEAYNKFPVQLEIIAVNLDEGDLDLVQYTKANQLSWLHYTDRKGFSGELPQRYSVNSLPATFLIAPDGKIVEKNFSGRQLIQFLEKNAY